MPSRAEVERYRRSQARLVGAAKVALMRFWSRADLSDLIAVRVALEELWPALIDRFGEASASLAAEWFEQQTGLDARLADRAVNAERVNASMRWGLGAAFRGDPGQAASTLAGVLSRFVQQHGRDTVAESAAANRIGWARVPSGSETCAFCMMLAGRGAVYTSASSAGEMREYHGDCDCQPVPVRDASDLPAGYDPGDLDARYVRAREAAGSGDPSRILSKMRELYDIN